MSKNTKTVICSGLAFSEEKDMKKLSKLAKEGWILDSFKNLSYKLKKSEPQDLIYCVDYNDNKEDLDAYFDIFEDSEWEHVCSMECYHFFKAPSGTKPIYTDEETLSSKYKWMHNMLKKTIIYCIISALVALLIANITGNINENNIIYECIELLAYMIFGGIVGLTSALTVATFIVKKKIVNKNK